MKGLALLLGKASPSKMGAPKPGDDEETEEAPDSEKGESGSETEYARMVIEAMQDGDTDGAAKALVSLVRCCK